MLRKTSILKLGLIITSLFLLYTYPVNSEPFVWDQMWFSNDGVNYDIGTNNADENTPFIYVRAGITHDDDESPSFSIAYITPGGEVYAMDASPSVTEWTENKEYKSVSFYIESSLKIAGSSAATAANSGDWRAELYINGVKVTSTWFVMVISDTEPLPIPWDRASHYAEITALNYPETISVGETARIEVTYYHDFYNEVQFHPAIQETSEGGILADEWITAQGKNSETIVFELTASEPGVYPLAAVMYYEYDDEVYWDDPGVVQFTITVQNQATTGPVDDPDTGIPGFPALASTIGIFLAAWQSRRMRRKIN